MKYTRARSSNELQRLDHITGNGTRADDDNMRDSGRQITYHIYSLPGQGWPPFDVRTLFEGCTSIEGRRTSIEGQSNFLILLLLLGG